MPAVDGRDFGLWQVTSFRTLICFGDETGGLICTLNGLFTRDARDILIRCFLLLSLGVASTSALTGIHSPRTDSISALVLISVPRGIQPAHRSQPRQSFNMDLIHHKLLSFINWGRFTSVLKWCITVTDNKPLRD